MSQDQLIGLREGQAQVQATKSWEFMGKCGVSLSMCMDITLVLVATKMIENHLTCQIQIRLGKILVFKRSMMLILIKVRK